MDSSADDFEIPAEVFDQIAAEEAAARGSGGGGSGESGSGTSRSDSAPATRSRVRFCPHCTFENGHGGSDCELCGLPL